MARVSAMARVLAMVVAQVLAGAMAEAAGAKVFGSPLGHAAYSASKCALVSFSAFTLSSSSLSTRITTASVL